MAKRPIAQSGAVIWHAGSIVLRRNKHGKWLFPKGHIEPGEEPSETALRESREETGLEVELVGELGRVLMREQKDKFDLRLYALRATGEGPGWSRHHGKDTFLVGPDQVAAHLSFPELRDFWEEHRARVEAEAGRPG